ncbi:MAG: DUF6174 domain-containing protein [Acidimicrobiia bacterium]|nr:DUF6174 domain-containing protein [Acidimicrobiia bacterium]
MTHSLSTLLVLVLLASCGSTAEQSVTSEPRDRWESAGVVDYEMTYGWSCECSEQSGGPFHVTVEDGVITSFVHVRGVPLNGDSRPLTVIDLFDRADQGRDLYGDDTEFTFDEELGYPTHISLGVSEQPADGGESLRVIEFTVSGR